MIRIGIAAPTPALRVGLRAMLTSSDVQVMAEVAAPGELSGVIATLDGVLLADDTSLDDLTELDLHPEQHALVVMSDDNRTVPLLHALPLRGWSIVPADTTPSTLLAAILAATQGLIVLSPSLANQMLERRSAVAVLDTSEEGEPLTVREREVLALLSQGLPNKQIARTLKISEHTVKFHVSSIYAKLGASSRAEAISRGARRGLISF